MTRIEYRDGDFDMVKPEALNQLLFAGRVIKSGGIKVGLMSIMIHSGVSSHDFTPGLTGAIWIPEGSP